MADPHAGAIVAALNARLSQLSTPREAFELDDLPADLPSAFVQAAAYRRWVEGSPRGDGEKSGKGYRVLTRAVAKTDGNARLLLKMCGEALEFVPLTVDGRLTTPLEFETEDPVESDADGWYVGAWTWTYLLTDNPA